jgi:hypothetical protein
MKIGVFGDSFAEKNAKEIWWRYISDFGHQVTSFGEGGSSLDFSAGELWTHNVNFDFCIWCVTSSNRVSFYHNNESIHITGAFDSPGNNVELMTLQLLAHQYLTQIYQPHGHEALNCLAVHGAVEKFDNLLIIPCFDTPVYFMTEPKFNLYQLSTFEAQNYFPGKDLYDIYQDYYDLRQGHFTMTTHRTLAEKINQAINYNCKIFCAEYSDFFAPSAPLSTVFRPK